MVLFSEFQHMRSGILGVNLLDDALQDAVLREDKSASESAQHRLAVHFFFTPSTKSLQHLRACIG